MPTATAPPSDTAADAESMDWNREVRRFIEAGGNTTHGFGLGRLIGRMFALLYLHPQPISLEEIAERLDISKASASLTARQLADWRAIRLVTIEGDRRDFYEAETKFNVIVREGLLPGMRKKLRSAGTQIGRTLSAAAPGAAPRSAENGDAEPNASEVREIRKRLKAARDLHGKLDRVLGSRLLDHFL
jgi:DNA-binding transcriptional regulator GbsR (MarR family)